MSQLSTMDKMYLGRYSKLYKHNLSIEAFKDACDSEAALSSLVYGCPQYAEQFNKNFYDLQALSHMSGILARAEGKEVCMLASTDPHPNNSSVLSLHPKAIDELDRSGVQYLTLYYGGDAQSASYIAIIRLDPTTPEALALTQKLRRHHCSTRASAAEWFAQ